MNKCAAENTQTHYLYLHVETTVWAAQVFFCKFMIIVDSGDGEKMLRYPLLFSNTHLEKTSLLQVGL